MLIPTTTMSAPDVKTMSAASGSPRICKNHTVIMRIFMLIGDIRWKKQLTFASAAGFILPNAKNEPPRMTNFFTLLAKVESLWIAKAKFVRGPRASIDISPGNSDTFSTKNSDADLSNFSVVGGFKFMFPNPSEPWTKSATFGVPPFVN